VDHQNNSSPSLDRQPVKRMEWERPYLEALIDDLLPFGDVLEVGFALGYSADRIQSFRPRHHTIIESDPEIFARALKWANHRSSITLIQEDWESALPRLSVFDTVFFNDLHLESEVKKLESLSNAAMVVEEGRNLIKSVKESLPQMMAIKYSDADLEAFLSQVGQTEGVAYFLGELMQNGQISKEQYATLTAKHSLEKMELPIPNSIPLTDSMLAFLRICLKGHMRKGSRFSCFASSPLSKFEIPEFFEEVITNPSYDYQEKLMPVEVPKSCKYYPYREALMILLKKQSEGGLA
jgi:hypothetical protein